MPNSLCPVHQECGVPSFQPSWLWGSFPGRQEQLLSCFSFSPERELPHLEGVTPGGCGGGHGEGTRCCDPRDIPAGTSATSCCDHRDHRDIPAVTSGTLLSPQGHPCPNPRDIPAAGVMPGATMETQGDAGPQGCGHYQAGQCPCHLQLQDSPWCPGQELFLPAHPSSPWRMLPALPNAPNSWDSLPFLPEKVESNLIPPGTPKGGELLLFIGIPARFQRLEKSHGDAWCAPYPLISSNYRA